MVKKTPPKQIVNEKTLKRKTPPKEDPEQRLSTNPMPSGAVDTLIYKIDKIEEGQEKIEAKVDSIHDAVFHPDQGLFARVNDIKNWKSNEEKLAEEATKQDEQKVKAVKDLEEIVTEQEKELKQLSDWKVKVVSTAKWTLVTIATTAVGVAGKLIYDALSAHFQ